MNVTPTSEVLVSKVIPFASREQRHEMQDEILEWLWGEDSGAMAPAKIVIETVREILAHPRFPLFRPSPEDRKGLIWTLARIETIVERDQLAVDRAFIVSVHRFRLETSIDMRTLPGNAERFDGASGAETVLINFGIGKLALAWQVHTHPDNVILTLEEARLLKRASNANL